MVVTRTIIGLIGLIAVASSAATAQSRDNFVSRILASHNAERAQWDEAPLHWNAQLAQEAQGWADHLAQTATFEHSPEPPRGHEEGENLWMGTRAAYTPEEMVGGWIDERADFVPGTFPNVSRTGNWDDVGHYTQLIWHDTAEVGCALAANASDEFLVCRYAHAGNWMGENPLGPNWAGREHQRDVAHSAIAPPVTRPYLVTDLAALKD